MISAIGWAFECPHFALASLGDRGLEQKVDGTPAGLFGVHCFFQLAHARVEDEKMRCSVCKEWWPSLQELREHW